MDPAIVAQIGKCVGWAELGRTCGNPPTTRCQPEKVATASTEAANHGMKAWEAGAMRERQPVGRGELRWLASLRQQRHWRLDT